VSGGRLALWSAIDLMDGRVVRLLHGKREAATFYDEPPARAAERFAAEGADGIHVVDLDAAFGTGSNGKEIEEILSVSDASGTPVQVGGGMRTIKAVEDFLEGGRGARAVLGSLALLERTALTHLLRESSSSSFSLAPRIVVALDCRDGRPTVRGWTADAGAGDAVSVARSFAELGVSALLVTDVARDGAMTGPNLELLSAVRAVFSGEILASGGMRGEEDLAPVDRVLSGGPRGAIFGRALHAGATTVAQLRAVRDLGRPA